MNKVKLNALVDIFAFVFFLASAVSGFVLNAFPPRSGRTGNLIWGLVKKDWHQVHYYASLAVVVCVLIHLLLHIAYIKSLTRILFKGKK